MDGFTGASEQVMSGVAQDDAVQMGSEVMDRPVTTPPGFEDAPTGSQLPAPLDGEIIPADGASGENERYVNSDKRLRAQVAVGIALQEAGPPDEDYLRVRDEEGRSLTKFIGSQANPLARGASALPVRKRGNRRRGALRAANNGRATPAHEDPIILRRRAIAMPLWNRGYSAGEIREAINTWLEAEGMEPVSEQTIRNDKNAIMESWEKDYDSSSAMNRQQHISAINRMKSEAWRAYEQIRDDATKNGNRGLGSASAFLKIALQAEAELAVLDGSKKRAEVQAAQSATEEGANKITRVYVGVKLEEV